MVRLLALVGALALSVSSWQPSTRLGGLGVRKPGRVVARVGDDSEEAAILRDAEAIAKKKRSNLYNENGVAYAPWMTRQIDEDAIATARALRTQEKRRAREAVQSKQGVVDILDAATSELTGLGLKTKVVDGEVELVWGTNDEEDNRGFVVEKKRVGASAWTEVATHATWAPLKSKGTLGGAYTYVDPSSEEGEWLYRVVAEQADATRQITCQVGVAVESQAQQLQTKIIVGAAAAVFLGLLAAGVALDPIKG